MHENIRGHLYEHYIPYVREATAKGYIVIAPEYRGSIGYGKEFFDAIETLVRRSRESLSEDREPKDPYQAGRSTWLHTS